jgi:hypothetical protein
MLIADAETRLCNAALTFQVTADAGLPHTAGWWRSDDAEVGE